MPFAALTRRARRALGALVVALPLAAQTPSTPEAQLPSATGTRRTSPIAVDGRQGTMRILAFITQAPVIDQILTRLHAP